MPEPRPLPTTTEGWLILIDANIRQIDEKVDHLIRGAQGLDSRLDALESWRDNVAGATQATSQLLAEHRQKTALISGIVGALAGLAGTILAAATGFLNTIQGRHP